MRIHAFLAAAAATALAPLPAQALSFVSAFAVPNGTDLSGLSGTGNNRFGGFGSDLIYDAGADTFFSTTDRGPGGGVLSYAPRYHGLQLDIDRTSGAIRGFDLASTTLYRTGSTTFDGQNPRLLTGSAATLGRSLDPEGLARLPGGNLLVSDEYGPSVYEFTPGGQFVRAFETPSNLVPRQANGTVNYVDGRPTAATGRGDNRGFEGLTVSRDGKTAYAILQDPLLQEGQNSNNNSVNAEGRFSRNVRIVAFDVASGKQTAQYIYQLEPLADINARVPGDTFDANSQGRSIGVSAIQAVGDSTLLVLERDNRGFGIDDPTGARAVASKRVYKIDLTGATDVKDIALTGTNTLPANVRPVRKATTPFLDFAAALRQAGIPVPEKLEGFAFGPRLADGSYTLILVTDNDYSVTQNNSGTQFDICTTGIAGSGKSEQVALGAPCSPGYSLIPNMVYSFRLSEAEYNALAAAVPEPATWATMMLGFGMIGAAARYRRRRIAAVA